MQKQAAVHRQPTGRGIGHAQTMPLQQQRIPTRKEFPMPRPPESQLITDRTATQPWGFLRIMVTFVAILAVVAGTVWWWKSGNKPASAPQAAAVEVDGPNPSTLPGPIKGAVPPVPVVVPPTTEDHSKCNPPHSVSFESGPGDTIDLVIRESGHKPAKK